ncbi:MAG: hypothetical protein UZ12_BCD005003299 [Bacteroidetes bacterium OLB12]|nr:MAG: hypothetical protein UZ12_BCD005003299 [Bacteroidetes bacterium OLB12]
MRHINLYFIFTQMRLLTILFLLFVQRTQAQTDSLGIIKTSQKFQQELNKAYKNKKTSPLNPADLRKFKRHDFFCY